MNSFFLFSVILVASKHALAENPSIPSTIEGNRMQQTRVSAFKKQHNDLLDCLSIDTDRFNRDFAVLLDGAGEFGVQFEPMNLKNYVVTTTCSGAGNSNYNDEDDIVDVAPILAIGVITAIGNTGHRNAMRETWLR